MRSPLPITPHCLSLLSQPCAPPARSGSPPSAEAGQTNQSKLWAPWGSQARALRGLPRAGSAGGARTGLAPRAGRGSGPAASCPLPARIPPGTLHPPAATCAPLHRPPAFPSWAAAGAEPVLSHPGTAVMSRGPVAAVRLLALLVSAGRCSAVGLPRYRGAALGPSVPGRCFAAGWSRGGAAAGVPSAAARKRCARRYLAPLTTSHVAGDGLSLFL